ncbi:hypothetical protein WJU23_05360 [Prosthecobacter sp. SYSU 5D2]|uniref:hypothetical protein n=1 Tax=Prosthecobacter sp. SYSU 5D2 TaxID=3134134 RepID=UPI0031FEFAD9
MSNRIYSMKRAHTTDNRLQWFQNYRAYRWPKKPPGLDPQDIFAGFLLAACAIALIFMIFGAS